jgi:multidrug efflux pump subunit AcrB
LVDDSTVTIENTHRLWTEEGKPLSYATLHGAAEIAMPTLVSTLAISCVFTSVVFLDGPAKYLFTPLGLAVVFAMLASYLLSRTLTPITIGLLLKGERHHTGTDAPAGIFSRISAAFERGFERLRDGYSKLLTMLLQRRFIVPVVAILMLGLGGTMLVLVGRDFFPLIDGGQIQLHVRAPAGTRIESTERIFQAVEDKIREIVPESDCQLIVDKFGLPARPYNLAFSDGSTIGVNDGVILVALREGHKPTADYIRKLREVLPKAFPESTFYFQAADIVTQILNFGLPAQIDVRTIGYGTNNLEVAKQLRQRISAIKGIVDAHLQQEVDGPAFYAMIDRARAARFGLNASTVATNINISLSSSVQVSPNFWTDPTSGIPYSFAVQTPEYRIDSLNALGNTPVSSTLAGGQPVPGMLSNVATFKRDTVPTNSNQTNIQPVFDIYASVQGRDLGSVAADINKVTNELQKELKPGNTIQVAGQIQSMNDSFRDLGIGLLFAAVLVYLLMVVNYQNFGDPFVVILALPATLCGIVTMLFITGTTLSVPSLMGAIMAVGVASANSILLVTFRARAAIERPLRLQCRAERRPHPNPSRADDGGCDDRRHDPDGDRRRRRGTERRTCARRDRRAVVRDADNVADRALPVRHAAQAQRRKTPPWRIRGTTRMSEISERAKLDNIQERRDPQTDRVVPLPNRSRKRPQRYGGALLGVGALLLLAGGLGLEPSATTRPS